MPTAAAIQVSVHSYQLDRVLMPGECSVSVIVSE